MKAVKYIAFALLAALIVSHIAFEPKKCEKTQFCLDTVVTLTAYGKGADKAIDKAFNRINEIEQKFSAYLKNSEIYKINHSPYNTFVKVDKEVFDLIERAIMFSDITDGAFDITLKPISDLWGIGTKNEKVPTDEEIKSALDKTGWRDVVLDKNTYAVKLKKEGMALDLGGIAKGYASDEAARVLGECGIKNACLDLGGNIVVRGEMPLGLFESIKCGKRSRPFTIGIQEPDAPRGESGQPVTVENGCVVTSGDYERFFEKDGERYHHIFDPKTGMPAKSGVRSATVIAKDGAVADALSTAFFVIGNDASGKYKEYYETVIFAK
ncbi:MAG: FAD:protein FMN transferase [Clostridia bacterium]|nr:FAD:protein FMN transferase [Clostridia bacterium]